MKKSDRRIVNDIRYTLFRQYTLIGVLVSLIFAVVNVVNKRPLVNIITGLAVAAICYVFYIISSKEKFYGIARVLFLMFFAIIYVPFSYTTTPGTYSAMPYLLILVIFIMAIIAVKKYEYIFAFIIIIESIILFRLEITRPELFDTYTDPVYRINDLSINFVVVTVAILLTIIFVMKRFSVYNEQIYDISIRDSLTGLYNKRYFDEYSQMEYNRSIRMASKFSIIFIDINNFKRINDEYGHQKGDEVLQNVGQILKDNMRSYDVSARYGGDEFIVILPNTNQNEAEELAGRLEQEFCESLKAYDALKIAVGLGVTDSTEKTLEEVIGVADNLLYRDKQQKKSI